MLRRFYLGLGFVAVATLAVILAASLGDTGVWNAERSSEPPHVARVERSPSMQTVGYFDGGDELAALEVWAAAEHSRIESENALRQELEEAERREALASEARRASASARASTGGAVVTDGDVWGALAQCECGGNPSCNTGNGYYGTFQFLPSTWRAVGGEGLPSDASYEEQLARAQELQRRAGWGQWPACSAKLGLR